MIRVRKLISSVLKYLQTPRGGARRGAPSRSIYYRIRVKVQYYEYRVRANEPST